MEEWRWYSIQNPVYMKSWIPIRILCFVGSDIKLLRIFNALTNYFHTKSCFRESLFCFMERCIYTSEVRLNFKRDS